MTHSPEFAFRIIALSLVVESRTLFLAVMVLGYLRSYFGRSHALRRAVTLKKISIHRCHRCQPVVDQSRSRSRLIIQDINGLESNR